MIQPVKVPSVAESITKVVIAEWAKPNGTWVEADQVLCSFETEKATMEVVAEVSGQLKHIAIEGATVDVGAIIAEIDTSVAAPTQAQPQDKPATQKFPPKAPRTDSDINVSAAQGHPSPAAAVLLAQTGIPPQSITGTGKDGRITHQDVQASLDASIKNPSTPPLSPMAGSTPAPAIASAALVRREPMSLLRKKVAQRLVSMKNQTAMTTTFNEVDMFAVQRLRTQYKDSFLAKHGVKLGMQSFFVKAVSKALQDFPILNAQVDGEDIVFFSEHNISFAVNSPKGLVVPVIRNVQDLSIAQIEKRSAELAHKGKEGKLALADMEGGTISITNGGVFGSMLSTPLLNPPQSAILGLHNVVERPVVIDGQIVVRPIMYVALSYDHRIIDGKDSVSFLVKIKKMIEDPSAMLLEV